MWVRRSQKEIERLKRSEKMKRFRIAWPVVVSLLGTALSTLYPELRSVTAATFVPSLPGCVTEGESHEEIRANLQEATELSLQAGDPEATQDQESQIV